MTEKGFRELLVEALNDLKPPLETALSPFHPPRSIKGARALGFLEGAAAALDVTVLELLWEFRLPNT